MTLEVTAVGIASSAGMTARDHALFIPSGSWGGRMVSLGEDPHLSALAAPWLDPDLPHEQRCEALGTTALQDVVDQGGLAAIAIVRPGLEGVIERLATKHGLSFGAQLDGDASVFDALAVAREWQAKGAASVVILALDCGVEEGATRTYANSRSPWRKNPPEPSEAAVAFRVGGAGSPVARLHFTGTASGSSHDDDDAPIDGAALTSLLRQGVEGAGPIAVSFGPHNVDQLRHLSWSYAAARCYGAFDRNCQLVCIEDELGRLGGASGAAHLAWGMLSMATAPPEGPWFVAWAISPDGKRGLCIGESNRG